MTDLTSLIERLEKAEGPDRELDRLIHFHVESPWLAEKCVKWVPAAFEGPNDFLWWSAERQAEGKEGYHDSWESYTASVDALMSLIHERLPEWRIATEHGENYSIAQFKRGWGSRLQILGVATSERADDEIALCIATATLRALQQRGGDA